MSHMAVKSGFLMKKNEQGNWQKRFVCTVPHLFLYYYDMEKSETPRGIIDLYYYTKMCQVGSEGNVLKLEGQSSAIREFFFQFNDANAMNDWMSDLYNDRYENIRAQRDAYKEMQDNFSGQMNDTARTLETTQRDTERLSIDIAEARQSVDEAKGIVIEAMSQLNVRYEINKSLKKIILKILPLLLFAVLSYSCHEKPII